MVDFAGVGHGLFHQLGVTHVAHGDTKPARVPRQFSQPLQVAMHTCPAEIVKNVDGGLRSLEQMLGQIGADETGTAENQHRTVLLRLHHPFSSGSNI